MRPRPKPATGRSERPTAVGAYIFAGGFTSGVREAGFKILAHFEDGDYGVATAKLNFPGLPVHTDPARWPTAELAGADFVYSNPPCAAWSAAGVSSAAKWETDARVDCTRRSFALVGSVRPKVWCWESVARAYTLGRPLVDKFTREALALGYSVTHLLVDARRLGCPQRRNRFFMVAHKVALPFEQPDFPVVTVREALKGVASEPRQELSGAAWVELLPELEHGREMRRLFESRNPELVEAAAGGRVIGRPSFQVRRLDPDDVSFTLTGGAQMIHPDEDRYISVPESAALCGYPRDFEFLGRLPQQYAQVAQAVMPPVGRWLAGVVKAGLEAGVASEGEVDLVDLRGEVASFASLTEYYASGPGSEEPAAEPAEPAQTRAVTTGRPVPRRPAAAETGGEVKAKPGSGVGAFIRGMLAEGRGTEAILAAVRSKFPDSKAGPSDVAWNKRKMRLDGEAGRATTEARQPTRKASLPSHVDPDREFDKTSLTASGYGYRVHRDYAAHFFRWGFARRFCENGMSVLDVGCGEDCPFVKTFVGGYPDGLPASYVGVDLHPLKNAPSRGWAEFKGDFNFLERHGELGEFDLVVCFEVIEHMRAPDGLRLLEAIREHLKPKGRLLLSTPVFDGKAAANHLHEWTVPELGGAVKEAGLEVVARYGTFANFNAIKKVCSREELQLVRRLQEFYSNDVVSCFLAPKYPDASRNNVWVLKREGE